MYFVIHLLITSYYINHGNIIILGKHNKRLNGAWHDEGRIGDTFGEDGVWNTLGSIH